jgi:hypothetical protein
MAVALIAIVVLAGQVASVSGAFVDVTRPGDPMVRVDGLNQGDGDAGPPPAAETVENAINDIGQKYLNFLDIDSGFVVTPSASGGLPVIGIRLYTANDVPERDPASFQLAGSNVSTDGPWEVISSGNLALPDGRNPGGNAVAIPPTGNLAAFHQEVLFDNVDVYEHYQIVFPTLKDAAAANSMQIAEVELLAVPEPAALALLAIGSLLMLTGRRRQG